MKQCQAEQGRQAQQSRPARPGHVKHGVALLLSMVPLVFFCTPALADGIAVSITNDGTDDLMVTVYDVSAGPKTVVLSQRINGFTTVPLNVSPDATGRGNVAWTAVTVDPHVRRCGHANRTGLNDAASVTVHADGPCGADQAATQG